THLGDVGLLRRSQHVRLCRFVVGSEGLRGRRRRQTRSEIHEAALRMALERGIDNVTVDDISADAGVSRRTFFKYFPKQEAAGAPAPMEIPAELAAEFLAAGPAPNLAILDDVIMLASSNLADNPPSREELADMLAVAGSSAAVTAAMLAQFDQFQRQLAGL